MKFIVSFIFMILSTASFGEVVTKICDINQDYEVIPKEILPEQVTFTNTCPKNIILIIGDGMGNGAYTLASTWGYNGVRERLFMERLPYGGLCTTHSKNSTVTDSAASGTAIATGVKVDNSTVAYDNETGEPILSVAEEAHKRGKKVAILTSDYLSGATPAAFYAHRQKRDMFEAILEDLVVSDFDIFAANDITLVHFKDPKNAHYVEKLKKAQYHLTENIEDFSEEVSKGNRVLGHFGSDFIFKKEKSLAQILSVVTKEFSKNENGFFIMLESCLPDKGGHANDFERVIMGTIQADWAVKEAVDYAAKNKDTLVIVTADHETGGVFSAFLNQKNPDTGKNKIAIGFTTKNHTEKAVPIYAYGVGAELFSGSIDNVNIAENIFRFLRQ